MCENYNFFTGRKRIKWGNSSFRAFETIYRHSGQKYCIKKGIVYSDAGEEETRDERICRYKASFSVFELSNGVTSMSAGTSSIS